MAMWDHLKICLNIDITQFFNISFTADCLDNCNNRGKCVVTAGGDNQCNCNLGWTGDTCEVCMANVGCNTNNTETPLGCQFTNNTNQLEDVPNSCQCKEEWTGPFCELPNCVDVNGTRIECVHGVCTAGGIVSGITLDFHVQ